jgi:hypothetical protein
MGVPVPSALLPRDKRKSVGQLAENKEAPFGMVIEEKKKAIRST